MNFVSCTRAPCRCSSGRQSSGCPLMAKPKNKIVQYERVWSSFERRTLPSSVLPLFEHRAAPMLLRAQVSTASAAAPLPSRRPAAAPPHRAAQQRRRQNLIAPCRVLLGARQPPSAVGPGPAAAAAAAAGGAAGTGAGTGADVDVGTSKQRSPRLRPRFKPSSFLCQTTFC